MVGLGAGVLSSSIYRLGEGVCSGIAGVYYFVIITAAAAAVFIVC